MTFQLLELGHPHLRRQAQPVQNIQSLATQQLIDDLLDFVEQVGGMGIAAPQVDVPVQIVILSSKPNTRYPHAPLMPKTVVINPEILARSDEQEPGWEGCLSVPGLRGLVPRSNRIQVRYVNREGKQVETEYEGFIARVFQHECDHLHGLLFTDRVASPLDLMSEREWQRQIIGQVEA